MFWIFSALLAQASPAFAQVRPAEVESPVSVSYLQLVKCYPQLKNDAWMRKVNLNELKEEIDRQFPTSRSLLRQREVLLKDLQGGPNRRLRLAAAAGGATSNEKPAGKKDTSKIDYHLTLEQLDSKGGGTPVQIPAAHRLNPLQADLNGYFLNREMLRDETSYFDTKLNGMTSSYKKNFKDITEIEIKSMRNSKSGTPPRRLLCEDQKDLGIVCTCFSK